MNTASKTVGTWEVTKTFDRDAKQWNVWTNSDGDEIALPENQRPTKDVVELFVANGMAGTIDDDDSDDNSDTEETAAENNSVAVDDSPQSALDRVVSQLANNRDKEDRAEIRVWRVTDPRVPEWCDKFTPEEWEEHDIDLVRKHFGPGEYRIEVWGTTARVNESGQPIKHGGKFVLRAKQTIKVGSALTPVRNTDSPTNDSAALVSFMQQMRQQNEAFMRAVSEQLKGKDTFADLERFVKLQALMNPHGSGNSTSISKLLADMKALEEFRGKKDDESPDTLVSIAGKILEVLPARGSQVNVPVAPNLSLPNSLQGNSQQNNPIDSTGDSDVNGMETLAVRAVFRSLTKAAERNEPVKEHARGLLAAIPEELLGILGMPTWFEILEDMQPEIMGPMIVHKEWFTKLRDSMLEQLDAAGVDEE